MRGTAPRLAALAVLAILTVPALAAPPDCFDKGPASAARIQACTDVLKRPLLLPQQKFAALMIRGGSLYLQHKFQQAIADYTAAIAISPQETDAWTARGNVYNTLGDFTRALRDTDAALRLAPGDPTLLNNRCWLHAAKREFATSFSRVNSIFCVSRCWLIDTTLVPMMSLMFSRLVTICVRPMICVPSSSERSSCEIRPI